MEAIRETIVHHSAGKIVDWVPRRRSLDHGTRRDRNLLSRALQEAEDEIDGAANYLDDLTGNELAWLLDDISEVAERHLGSEQEHL